MTAEQGDSPSLPFAGGWWVWRDMAVRAPGFPVEDLCALGHPKLAQFAAEDDGADDGEAFRAEYQDAVDASCATLAEIVDGESFRAALLWQHGELVGQALERFLERHRAGGARTVRDRRRERLLTKYVQRYHAKNESIGFFGPVAWAGWEQPADPADAAQPAIEVRGFHGDLAERRAQMELWAVREVARRFSADPEMRPWLTPVRGSHIAIRDGQVRTALRGWAEMPRPRYDVLAACDGETTVAQMAERLIAAAVPGITSIADVERQLAALERVGYVALDIQVPPTAHADGFLQRRIAGIPDAGVRERFGAVLGRVRTAADAVREAGGDPKRLEAAFAQLEEAFTAACGADAHRGGEDRPTIGRSLMVEDCRSALTAVFRPPLLADLAEPLGLVLDAARWLVDQIGAHYLEILRALYDRLLMPERTGVGVAALLPEFWAYCTPEAFAAETAPVVAEFQRRLAGLLRVPEGVGRHAVAAADIAEAVHETFAARSAPWLSGRAHCPDMMIAAADVASIASGDYTWVIGEMHSGAITLNQGTFVLSHPDRARVQAMADEDARRGPWMVPLYPSDWPDVSSRSYPPPYLTSPGVEYVQMSAEPPREATAGTVVPSSLLSVVCDDAGTLWLQDDQGRRRNPLALFGEFLTESMPDAFRPFAPAPHRPRVSVDRLVLAREQWRVTVGALAWASTSDEPARYRAVQRWACELGLPRHVFVRVEGERKPYYVDLSSPLLVNMIAAVVRTAARDHADSAMTITEMHPGPDEAWLPHGPGGARCLSELRIAIVDRADD
jgi:hypothetical protein